MTAFLYRMPAGIAGELNRIFACVVETQVITPKTVIGHPTAYGIPLMIDATVGNVGNMRALAVGDAALPNLVPYGLLARPYPTGGSQDSLGVSTPPDNGACDVLKSGYMNVILSGTTAAIKGSPVYIWVAAPVTSHITGGWEVSAASTSTILVAGSYFMGAADAGGNTEISFNV